VPNSASVEEAHSRVVAHFEIILHQLIDIFDV
jgi:hypothetical protein